MITRRQLLLGGAGLGALALGAEAEQPRLRQGARRLLLGDPEPAHPLPSGQGTVVQGTFTSRAMQTTTRWSVAYPGPVTPGLPVLLVLHGRGDDARAVLGSHRLGAFLTQAVQRGTPPFAVVAVDGGDHTYWHRRASGQDPQAMLTGELLPLLSAHGLQTRRVALGGWSMGGYGALLLAERLGSSRITAVAVDSPAIWRRASESAPGAFDDPTDFTAHDVLAGAADLAEIPVRVSCGTSDPFLPGVRALLRDLPHAEHDLAAGVHDLAWWQHAAPAQLAFVGRQLRR